MLGAIRQLAVPWYETATDGAVLLGDVRLQRESVCERETGGWVIGVSGEISCW